MTLPATEIFMQRLIFVFCFPFASQIYTEWANYYLERAKSKRTVGDLSTDCRDGLLLAEVIEAVTTFKVPDLIKKPKTQQQMVSESFNSITDLDSEAG
jgi:Calponin homology (CH) domain